MSAEIAGVSVLTKVLDRLFEKSFSLENFDDCINRFMEDNGIERQSNQT